MITYETVAAECKDYDRCAVGACIPAYPCIGCPALLMKRHPPAEQLGAGWALQEAANHYPGGPGPIIFGAVDSEGGDAD